MKGPSSSPAGRGVIGRSISRFSRRRAALLSLFLPAEPGGGARRVAEHVVAAWHDLSQFRVGPQAARFVSLFDDTSDVWSEDDFRLVESLSDISRWTRPDEFIELLRIA